MTRPANLPDFSHPPLYELVLSIQFGRTQLRNVNVGGLWEGFRSKYPTVEEQAPLMPVFEKFGLPPGPADIPQFILSQTPDVIRYWFVSADGNELLQIQPDRLVHNWRRNDPEASYPRYESLRSHFEKEVKQVEKFLLKNELGSIQPNQCEVSYINHITFDDGSDFDDRYDEIFTIWQEVYSSDFLNRIERGQFNIAYVIRGADSQPFGRLHVQAHPAIVRTTSKRVLQFTLTVRGKPAGDTVESAFAWLDKGRETVVRAFTALTRQEMHRLWGRTDG